MKAAQILSAPVMPEMLERAGLRLELAASVRSAWRPTSNETRNEMSLGAVEHELDAARTAYRAMLELMTGLDVTVLERRLSV